MKYQSLFCRKNMKDVINLSSANSAYIFRNRYWPCVTLPDINLELWREGNQTSSQGFVPRVQAPFSPLNSLRLQNVASFMTPNGQARVLYK